MKAGDAKLAHKFYNGGLMAVWALGINHHTAPLDLRGRFAFALDQIAPTLQGLRQSLASSGRHDGVETAILSTCNRTEIYGAGDNKDMDHTLEWLAHNGGVSPALLRSHAYTLQGDQVARHAFRVASGLDRKSTRLNSSHLDTSRMPSSA